MELWERQFAALCAAEEQRMEPRKTAAFWLLAEKQAEDEDAQSKGTDGGKYAPRGGHSERDAGTHRGGNAALVAHAGKGPRPAV